MFGTSGVRGLYGMEVNEELALIVANIFADKDVAIGMDTRKTAPSLMHAACAGILARGKNAIALGIVPTPTVALATKKYHCHGIMITASHNPEEYTGIKLMADGIEISRAWEEKISAKLRSQKFKTGLKLAEWDKVGKMTYDNNIITNHIEFIKKQIDCKAIVEKKPKIIIDCNGAGTVITPKLLSGLGCEVISINDSLNGFSRASEPCEANLSQLVETVCKHGADIGIAHDGDADRAVAVDESGKVLSLDSQLAIMIEHEMQKESGNKKII